MQIPTEPQTGLVACSPDVGVIRTAGGRWQHMLNVPGTRGEASSVHTSSLHPHDIQPESRELVASAHQRSKEWDPLTREWSREEGSGEIQEGI